MKDRNVQFPHRYQMVPVAGQESVYDFVPVPGTITEPGTPINKATLFSDATAALYGLAGDDAVPDKALSNVGELINHEYGNAIYSENIAGSASVTKTIKIGDGKRFGRCTIMGNQTAHPTRSALVFFSTESARTMTATNAQQSSTWSPAFFSRSDKGAVIPVNTNLPTLGTGVVGDGLVRINELYISGGYIRIEIENPQAGVTRKIDFRIDWEVW